MNWKLILAFISMVVDFFSQLLEKGQSKEALMILSSIKSTTTRAQDLTAGPKDPGAKNG